MFFSMFYLTFFVLRLKIITLLEICCFERQDMSVTEMKKFISKRELVRWFVTGNYAVTIYVDIL